VTWTRRDVLRLAGGLAAVPLAGACVEGPGGAGGRDGRRGRSVPVRFERPLDIPPLARSSVDGQGRRVFDLTARAGQREFTPGRVTRTWGLNGDYLGPTLRARRGEVVVVNVHNELDESTTMHWHGMHLPAVADGGPHQPVEPGRTWSPSWRIEQPAATLWYHPHPHGRTARHVYRGLAGMFVLDDSESTVDLPHEYGVDDVPVIVQDRRFGGDGRFLEGQNGPTGMLGDTLLVNGTVAPYLEVTTERIRLRLLNASNARIYSFGFSDGRLFALVGTDGGLLPAPHRTDRVRLSPGERAEVVVEVRAGERVVLRSYPPRLGVKPGVARLVGGGDTFDVLELRAAAALRRSAPLPSRLADAPDLAPADAATTRRFRLDGFVINGREMDMDRIDETVTAGTTEIWEATNTAAIPHNLHVHGVRFQVLQVGGDPPPPELAGWKDTVYLPPQVPVRTVMRFGGYTDPVRPYMYHCHLLFHEDFGMMGQYVVVEPGQAPAGGGQGHGHGG
jgi:blue copper oxidase